MYSKRTAVVRKRLVRQKGQVHKKPTNPNFSTTRPAKRRRLPELENISSEVLRTMSSCADLARRSGTRANYPARVLGGHFRPSARGAFKLAEARGQSLDQFAIDIGLLPSTKGLRKYANLDLGPEGWCRAEVARAAGLATSDVSRFLSGKHPPTFTKLVKIAVAMGVRPSDLYEALTPLIERNQRRQGQGKQVKQPRSRRSQSSPSPSSVAA